MSPPSTTPLTGTPTQLHADAVRTQKVAKLRRQLRLASCGADAAGVGSLGLTPSGRDPAGDWFSRLGVHTEPRRLVDCLGAVGSGVGLVALDCCRRARRRRGELVVVEPGGEFFVPAAIAWGIDASRLLVVRPESEQDTLAATEIALRSPSVGAVWASVDRVTPQAFRRLLLAAESGEAFGALVRPIGRQAEPSWGDVQLRFEPLPDTGGAEGPDRPLCVRVTRTRNRHGPPTGRATLAIDWRAGRIEDVTRPGDVEANQPTDGGGQEPRGSRQDLGGSKQDPSGSGQNLSGSRQDSSGVGARLARATRSA